MPSRHHDTRLNIPLLYFDQQENGGLNLALQEDSAKTGKVSSAGMYFLGFPVYRLDKPSNSVLAQFTEMTSRYAHEMQEIDDLLKQRNEIHASYTTAPPVKRSSSGSSSSGRKSRSRSASKEVKEDGHQKPSLKDRVKKKKCFTRDEAVENKGGVRKMLNRETRSSKFVALHCVVHLVAFQIGFYK
ncbi:hypothetical protein Tco_0975832 [Tanacetum coccineum]|uniref:Uncharacterized protein n=1 Tax=Tanacetum coccineum TaxID=301880 RepID=A0ABQ5EFJ4_9ASTR